MAIRQRGNSHQIAENGIEVTNSVCLEPEVYRAFTEYVASLKAPAHD